MAERDEKELHALRQEVAGLKRSLVNHPSANAIRFIAPFVRDAIEAGVWKPGMGEDSVEHEVRAALSWLDRMETETPRVAVEGHA